MYISFCIKNTNKAETHDCILVIKEQGSIPSTWLDLIKNSNSLNLEKGKSFKKCNVERILFIERILRILTLIAQKYIILLTTWTEIIYGKIKKSRIRNPSVLK